MHLKKIIPQTHSAYGKVSYHMILYCIISLSTIPYIMIFFLYSMLFSSPKQWKPFWNCILIWGNDIAHWSLLHLASCHFPINYPKMCSMLMQQQSTICMNPYKEHRINVFGTIININCNLSNISSYLQLTGCRN